MIIRDTRQEMIRWPRGRQWMDLRDEGNQTMAMSNSIDETDTRETMLLIIFNSLKVPDRY